MGERREELTTDEHGFTRMGEEMGDGRGEMGDGRGERALVGEVFGEIYVVFYWGGEVGVGGLEGVADLFEGDGIEDAVVVEVFEMFAAF